MTQAAQPGQTSGNDSMTPKRRHRLKTTFRMMLILLILCATVLRVYHHFVPWHVSLIPYTLASVSGPKATSPDGRVSLSIVVNDAGAMHSGCFWTWIIDDSWFWGRYVVAEGYLRDNVAFEEQKLPLVWMTNKSFKVRFCSDRAGYAEEVVEVRL
jgi:hypothetical protein